MIKYASLAAATATAAVLATATPSHAFERMLRSDCQVTFEKLVEMVEPLAGGADPMVPAILDATSVNAQGWCRIDATRAGLEDLEFDRLEWRAEDIRRWTVDGIPPLALEFHITGLEPYEMQRGGSQTRPPLTVTATLRQDPSAGQIIIESAVMTNGVGDVLSVSGLFERVFLSSPSMMQVSMGSVAFKAGLMSMTLEGTHENPFGFGVDVTIDGTPQSQSQMAFDTISRMPEWLMDDASRAELTAYAADLPRPVGNLEVVVGSENGLGLMQLGASLYAGISSVMTEEEVTDEFEILFNGLSLTANWTPAAQMAD